MDILLDNLNHNTAIRLIFFLQKYVLQRNV